MRKIMTLVMAALVAVAVAGCSTGIVGTWVVKSASYAVEGAQDVDPDQLLTGVAISRMDFSEDGNVALVMPLGTQSMAYAVDGNTVLLYEHGAEEASATLTLDGKELKLGDSIVFEKK